MSNQGNARGKSLREGWGNDRAQIQNESTDARWAPNVHTWSTKVVPKGPDLERGNRLIDRGKKII